MHELQKITLLRTSHIISKKDTIHQINFYLILTPGPRKRLGYYVLLWYKVKEDSLNNNKKNP